MIARSFLIYVFALLVWSHVGIAQETKFDQRMSRLVEAQVTSRFQSVVKTLLVEDRRPEWPAVIQVSLLRRASEAELTEVATLVRSAFQPSRFVFNFYTLPGMRNADGACSPKRAIAWPTESVKGGAIIPHGKRLICSVAPD